MSFALGDAQLAGCPTVLVKTQFGTLPADMTRDNMEAIARETLPDFQDGSA
jgi:hypothetical protein